MLYHNNKKCLNINEWVGVLNKLYSKYVNGELRIMPKSKIVIINKTKQIFNPTEKMLLKDGVT